MSENDIFATIKKALIDELNKKAEELITNLVGEFCRELQNRKGQVIGDLIENIEFIASNDPTAQCINFQINIRNGDRNCQKELNLNAQPYRIRS